MTAKSRFSVWGPFVAAVLLSWIVGETALSWIVAETPWSTSEYYLLLDLLGILNVILAVRVLVHTGLRLWPILGVLTGLVLGQLRIIERATALLLWRLGGFAP
jgi:hypothetical protein